MDLQEIFAEQYIKKVVIIMVSKKQEKEKKQILLRLSPSLWREVAGWAEDDFRSINSQIEFLLSENVKKRKNEAPSKDYK